MQLRDVYGNNVDSTAFSAYVSGGTAECVDCGLSTTTTGPTSVLAFLAPIAPILGAVGAGASALGTSVSTRRSTPRHPTRPVPTIGFGSPTPTLGIISTAFGVTEDFKTFFAAIAGPPG